MTAVSTGNCFLAGCIELANYTGSCSRTNNALLPTRYYKHIVCGRCLLVCRLFLYSVESATDGSGGTWLARANSEHPTYYNRTVCYLTCQMKSLFNASNSVIVK